MFTIIIIVYAVAFFAFWLCQFAKAVPGILGWVLFIAALPILLPVGMYKSLPLYLKKDGKMYKYRWVIWFNVFVFTFLIIVMLLPAS